MASYLSRQWLIAERPLGRELRAADFSLAQETVGSAQAGELVLRTRYLGFDPSQKGVMENLASYAAPVEIGAVMPGLGVAEVLESQVARIPVGSLVAGPVGWREFARLPADDFEIVPEGFAPTAALGILGITGRTAYFGLFHVGKPQPGDVLVVSGAAGAVGSTVGQLGKLAGCRVIGIAGGAAKCRWLEQELGFDAAIDYKSQKLRSRLKELAPNGINVFFDNVGGSVLNDCLTRIAVGARIVICGGISRYNSNPRDASQIPPGPQNYFNLVATHATMQGFLVHHFADQFPTAQRRLEAWLRDGKLRNLEDVIEGFESAPDALIRLFAGANLGKQILRIEGA